VYPDERVARLIQENFIPVKIHVKENRAGFERFGAHWTPTVIVADPEGAERYRFEGYLPADEFMAQLQLGLAKIVFVKHEFGKAEQLYSGIVTHFPNTAAAPESLYWAELRNSRRLMMQGR